MTAWTCPCCGSAVASAASLSAIDEICVGPMQRRVLNVLRSCAGHTVNRVDIVTAVFSTRLPTDSQLSQVSNSVHRLRPHLAPLGWAIETYVGPGVGYRLVPVFKGDGSDAVRDDCEAA